MAVAIRIKDPNEEITDDIDFLFSRENLNIMIEPDQIEDNKRRAISIRKMIKNYSSRKKTNYRLLLNHIIIIQNSLGVPKTIQTLSYLFNSKENYYLNSFFYFLKYIEYNENMCYDLFKDIQMETR